MRNRNIDMTKGKLLPGMFLYTLPILFSNILALLYHTADQIVVGQFSTHAAFAAVGSTGALSNLFTVLFYGISAGGCIVVAQYYGARDGKNVSETVHTCILVSIIGGVLVALFGNLFCEDILALMGTPEEILPLAAKYMHIIFVSQIFGIYYAFVAGIIRASGDSNRPFLILLFTGLVNVVLNLFFVIVCGMDVDGVAYATLIGAALNALFGTLILLRSSDSIRLDVKRLRIHKDKFLKVLAYGIPQGLQSILFAVSNIAVQTAINSLSAVGAVVNGVHIDGVSLVGGNAAGGSVEGFVYNAMTSVTLSTRNFVAANYGARQYKRCDSSLLTGEFLTFSFGAVIGWFAILFSDTILGIYQPTDVNAVIYGGARVFMICSLYFLCGMYESLQAAMRGIGSSWLPTISVLITVGLGRILWLTFIFPHYLTPFMLYVIYPISWGTTVVVMTVGYLLVRKKRFAANEAQYAQAVA